MLRDPQGRRPQSRWGRAARKGLWVLIGLLLLQLLAMQAFLVVMPGVAEPVADMVQLDPARQDPGGGLYLTAVATDRANLLTVLYSVIHPAVELVPLRREIPRGVDLGRYLEIMERLMEESQHIAVAVALQHLGMSVNISGEVLVEEVLPGSPAQDELLSGDVLVAIDGEEIATSQDAIQRIQARSVGDAVDLAIRRQDQEFHLQLRTVALEGDGDTPGLRILISSQHQYDFPIQVAIDAGVIKGSSAGLMFALEVYRRLAEDNLLANRKIAGSGALALDGSVQAVTGVRQKVLTAERVGADLFLVPQAAAAEAEAAADRLRVVPVASFAEAVAALLNEATTP